MNLYIIVCGAVGHSSSEGLVLIFAAVATTRRHKLEIKVLLVNDYD